MILMSVCRIIFCWIAIRVPTASDHER